MNNQMHGGKLIGELLAKHGVKFLYTLCGGHISPILVGAEEHGIRVIDTRHEVTAVFAADATARLTGITGVAAVTAGPGMTNTITAIKNAQMAQSPVVLLGGAAATMLKGRGALQDIDQLTLMKPLCKFVATCKRVRDIVPTLEKAFKIANEGVPGPVFVELPVDLLYQQEVVSSWTVDAIKGKDMGSKAMRTFLSANVKRTFSGAWTNRARVPAKMPTMQPNAKPLSAIMKVLATAKKPLLVIGSQAMIDAPSTQALQEAVLKLGIPTYLSGMARGLLGRNPLHIRHKRSKAMKEADVIILAGVPVDFRLNYGNSIPRSATYISINLSKEDLTKNRKPKIGIHADPSTTIRAIAARWTTLSSPWKGWHGQLIARDTERDIEIHGTADIETEFVNPVRLCQQVEAAAAENSIFIGDGGDFVGTASYIVRPRAPLCWLDPGAFGTLGAGGGFALAAKLVRPDAEVWLLYGDGSCGYSLAEFDTFARHNVPIIAVVGNDASWAQIAREQVEILGTSLGTDLVRADYHVVAQGYGGAGLCVDDPAQVEDTITQAQQIARDGTPILINAKIGSTDFRKGSLSM